ncbi:hypothetical protein [Cellulomonas olei]|uniref:hypothetical protein n=1 Tax=Cellulomonas sp. P4 TaxID=3142533 RepID=UPI0031BB4980
MSEAPVLRDAAPAVTTWTPRESWVRAGVGRADITPPVGVRAHNWGASRTEVATGVHRPLTATALAFHDAGAGRWRYLLTLDLGWWRDAASFARLRDPLLSALGAEPDDLLLHLVHTHAGPSVSDLGLDLPGADLLDDYHRTLEAGARDACETARDAAVDAVVTWGTGWSDLAVTRNLPCGDRDVVAFDPGTPADGTLLVGRVSTAGGGAPLGVLLNYACHPTTLAHHNSLLSPDLVGAAREVVEAAAGAPCLFLQGASGELSPREQYGPGTEQADRNGRALGHAAVAVLEQLGEPGTRLRFDGVVESGAPLGLWVREPAPDPAGVRCTAQTVPLAARPVPTAEQVAEQWAGIDPVAAAERLRRATRLADGYVTDGVAGHPLWVWGLGDAVLVAHPGEAFSALQTELRRRHPDRAVLVLNLTNGPGFVYLPDRASYDRDRYQVWQTLLAPGGLEDLTAAADAAVAALPRPREVTA